MAQRDVGDELESDDHLPAQGDQVATEERVRLLLASLAEGVTFQDANGAIHECNESAERILGLTRDQILGRTSMDPRWRAIHEDGSPFPGDTHPAMVALRTGERLTDVIMGVCKPNGDLTWISINAQPLFTSGESKPYALVTSFFDITERKRAADLIRESEDNFRTLFDTIADLLFVLDEQGSILRVNRTVKNRLGYTEDELVGRSVLWVHPEDRREEAATIVANMLAGKADSCPVPLITKDGQLISVATRVVKGKWSGQDALFGISKDRSELRASEERFSAAFRNNPSPMAITAVTDNRILDVNDAFLRVTGYDRHEVISSSAEKLDLFADPRQRETALRIIQQTGRLKDFEAKLRTRAGEIRDGIFSADIIQLQDQRIQLTVMDDITERKRAEKALLESEERYRLLVEAIPEHAWRASPDGLDCDFNQYWFRYTGQTPAAAHCQGWLAAVHPEERLHVAEQITHAVQTEEPYEIEYRLLRVVDGRYRWHLARAVPMRGVDGAVTCWYGTATDIEDLKQAQEILKRAHDEALRGSELRYRTIFGAVNDALLLVDVESGQILEANPAAITLYGYTHEELLKLKIVDLSAEPEKTRRAMLEGFSIIPLRYHRKQNGEIIQVEIRGRSLNWDGRIARVVAVRDITERVHAEDRIRLMQSELAHVARLSVMGELVAGLAHEVNQPLSAIINYAKACRQLIEGDPPDRKNLRKWMKQITTAASRAGDIIHKLRDFARRKIGEAVPVPVHELVRDALTILEFEAKHWDVLIDSELDIGEVKVRGDRVQMQQVLVNLLLNAYEAFDGTPTADRRVTVAAKVSGKFVEVAVVDNGLGLPKDLPILDPFVTTKKNGLGLGLAISQAIVEAHGGRLWTAPNRDRGTTFCFTIPLALAEEA